MLATMYLVTLRVAACVSSVDIALRLDALARVNGVTSAGVAADACAAWPSSTLIAGNEI